MPEDKYKQNLFKSIQESRGKTKSLKRAMALVREGESLGGGIPLQQLEEVQRILKERDRLNEDLSQRRKQSGTELESRLMIK